MRTAAERIAYRKEAIRNAGFVKCPCGCGMSNTIHAHRSLCVICGRGFNYDPFEKDSEHQPMNIRVHHEHATRAAELAERKPAAQLSACFHCGGAQLCDCVSCGGRCASCAA